MTFWLRFSSWGALIRNFYEARTSRKNLASSHQTRSEPPSEQTCFVAIIYYILQVGYICSIFTCLDSVFI